MKRKGLSFISLILCIVLMLSGCTGTTGGDNSAPDTAGAQGGTVRLVIGSGPIGGALYPIAGGIAAIINENVDGVSCTVQVTGGGIENVRLVSTGQVDLGMSAADQVYDAVNNSGMFEGEGLKLGTLGTLHASVQQIVTLKSSGIKSFEDLKGKKVAIGEPGGGSEVAIKQTIKALGWTEEDIEMVYLPYDQAMDQLADGLIDAGCVYAGVPSPTITALATQREVEIIHHNEETVKKIQEASPLFTFIEVPTSTYTGMSSPAIVPAQRIMLTATEDLDPALAEKICAAIYENLDELVKYHASAESITLEDAPKTSAPLNSGADKYFRDKGLLS